MFQTLKQFSCNQQSLLHEQAPQTCPLDPLEPSQLVPEHQAFPNHLNPNKLKYPPRTCKFNFNQFSKTNQNYPMLQFEIFLN